MSPPVVRGSTNKPKVPFSRAESAEDNYLVPVRVRINIAVSILAIMAIVWGVRFAIAQERRRTPRYLEAMYEELNERFFENTLPTARFEWTDLTNENAMGLTFQESEGFVIQVDRKTNFSLWTDDELRDTMEHETCHIVTWGAEQDAHGPRWQACMAHLKAQADHKHN